MVPPLCTSEAKGHCPQWHNVIITQLELTFLGDAKEAGEHNNAKKEEKKLGVTKISSTAVNDFHLIAMDSHSTNASGGAR
jgi:hypothetical protein